MLRIKVMVAAHKKFPMPNDNKLYLPVLVGAIKNYRPGIEFQRDDEGINISRKNPNYNELTAVYWAWKNLKKADVIGLVHYRRFFESQVFRNKPINQNEIERILQKSDVILPKKRKYYIETNRSHYLHAHNSLPLIELDKVIKEKYPDYSQAYDVVMKARSAHMFNMFIMKTSFFDDYSKFIFNVLSDLENRIDISDFSTQEARVYGYLSELLMDVWLKRNNINYSEVKWFQIGKKHIIKKMFYFICRKFGFNSGKTHF